MSSGSDLFRPPLTESRGFRYVFTLWVAISTILLVAVLTVGVESAAGDQFEVVDVVKATTLPASPSPQEQYPSVMYAGMVWSLTEARLIPRTDDAFSRPFIVTELLATNVTADTELRARKGDLAVMLADGSIHPAKWLERTASSVRFSVDPGRTEAVTAVFELIANRDPNLWTVQLRITEPGRIPALLPLDGEPVEPMYPLEAGIEGGPATITDPDDPTRQMIVEANSASVDIDAAPYRAAIGERLGVIEVSVQRASGNANAAYLDEEFWRLDVGAERLTPIRVVKVGQPAVNTDEVRLLFVFAAGPTEMTLTAAANTDSPLAFTISAPDYGEQ